MGAVLGDSERAALAVAALDGAEDSRVGTGTGYMGKMENKDEVGLQTEEEEREDKKEEDDTEA